MLVLCQKLHITVLRPTLAVVRSTSQSYGDSKISGEGGQNSKTPEPIDKKYGVDDYAGDDSMHAKTPNDCPNWGRGGVCVKYHPRVVFSVRCNIYISCLCYDVRLSVSVCL